VISLQKKIGWYLETESRVEIYKSKFNEIKKILSDAPSFAESCRMLSEVGMKYSDFTEFYGKEKIDDAYLYAKDLKDRYTVLWLYYDLFGARAVQK